MPGPTIVWMVHLGRGLPPTDVRGTLTLGDAALEFTAVGTGGGTRIEYPAIRRARRIRGSPVLLVDWLDGDVKRRTAFYFSQPPSLNPEPRSSSLTPGPLGPFRRPTPTRRQVARMNLGYLRSTSVANRGLLREWQEAVEARASGG